MEQIGHLILFHHFSPFFVTPFSPIISPWTSYFTIFCYKLRGQVAKTFLFFFHKSSEIAPHRKKKILSLWQSLQDLRCSEGKPVVASHRWFLGIQSIHQQLPIRIDVYPIGCQAACWPTKIGSILFHDCRSMVYGIVSVMNVPLPNLPSIKQISRPFPIVVLQVDGFNPM